MAEAFAEADNDDSILANDTVVFRIKHQGSVQSG